MAIEFDNLDDISGTEAKTLAQRIAFAPFSFYAAVIMRDSGLLDAVSENEPEQSDLTSLSEQTELSEYATSLLLDFGEHLGLVTKSEDRYELGSVGFFILHDEMTEVNMNFTRDMGYAALPYLKESFDTGKPVGLQETLGSWETLYQGLRDIPEPARSSWHRFDHFYSERSFSELVPRVFDQPVDSLLDVGGNLGIWTLQFLKHDPDVDVYLLDLPRVLKDAKEEIQDAGFDDRVTFLERDLRQGDIDFPEEMDVIWMSQLLDCFPPEDIVTLLKEARSVMDRDSRLMIVELFPDRQDFEAGSFCLNAISLYFTCIANGTSRMYPFDDFREYIDEAGLHIEEIYDVPTSEHTLLDCRVDR